MFKVFGFLTKRAGMEMQDFMDYLRAETCPVDLQLGPYSHPLQTQVLNAERKVD